MKFLIQKIDGKIVHDFSFTLLQTLEFKKWLNRGRYSTEFIVKYVNSATDTVDFKFKPFHRDYVPVGSVEFVSSFLQHFYGLTPKPKNVPEELFSFAKRYVFNGTETYFPHCGKSFIKSNDKIKGTCGIFNQDEPINLPAGNYQFSGVISIDSEWRAFVYENKLVGLQNYSGDFTSFPNVQQINNMINAYEKVAPIAYTLDVAVCDSHTFANDVGTVVVEVHDFFSCGLYGFNNIKYPNMLHRWFREYLKNYGF